MTDIKETIEKYDKNYDQYLETFKRIKADIDTWYTAIIQKNKGDIPTKENFTSAIEKIENIRKNINDMYGEYSIHSIKYNSHYETLRKNNESTAQQIARNLQLTVLPKSTAYSAIMTLKQNLQADQLPILKIKLHNDDTPKEIAEKYIRTLNIKNLDKFEDSLNKLEFFNDPDKTSKNLKDDELEKIIGAIVEVINENIKLFDEVYEKYEKFKRDFNTFKEKNFDERYKILKEKIELEYNQLTSEISSIKAYFENKSPEPEEEASSATIVKLSPELEEKISSATTESGEEKKISSETIVKLSPEPKEEASSKTIAKLPSKEQKRERSIWDWVLLIFLVIVVAIGLITIIGIFIAFIYAVLDERRRYKKTGEWALGRVVLNSLFNWYYIYKYWMTYGII